MWSASPIASSMDAEHSRSTMNNGWFIGLISWETEMPVFPHGLSPLVAQEMESGGKCPWLVPRTSFRVAKRSLTSVLKFWNLWDGFPL